jgi:hypothetical protein
MNKFNHDLFCQLKDNNLPIVWPLFALAEWSIGIVSSPRVMGRVIEYRQGRVLVCKIGHG